MLETSRRIVVKVGTSTLTHATGALNIRRIGALVQVLSDFKNAGKEIVLVSSGAVSAGVAKVGAARPSTIAEKQAMAAIGQSELMRLYDQLFSLYGHTVAQVLLTRDVLDNLWYFIIFGIGNTCNSINRPKFKKCSGMNRRIN